MFLTNQEKRHEQILTKVLYDVSEGNKKELKKSIADYNKISVKSNIFTEKELEELSRTTPHKWGACP